MMLKFPIRNLLLLVDLEPPSPSRPTVLGHIKRKDNTLGMNLPSECRMLAIKEPGIGKCYKGKSIPRVRKRTKSNVI